MTAVPSCFDEEPVFPEETMGIRRKLDFYGHTIPPLQRELRRRLHAMFRDSNAQWYAPPLISSELYGSFRHARTTDDLPHLIACMGLGRMNDPDFVDRWIRTGALARQDQPPLPTGLEHFSDPLGLSMVYGIGCWLILVDLPRLNGRPLPRRWEDLLSPLWRDDLIVNASGGEIAQVLAFNIAHDFGLDGLTALGRNARAFWGGAKMARACGTDNPDGAAVYVMPRFWTQNNIHPSRVRVVWPEDGAYCTPMTLMMRPDPGPHALRVRDFLLGDEWHRIMTGVGVITTRSTDVIPGPLRWIGWDQARSGTMPARRMQLAQALAQGQADRKGYPS